MITRHDVESNPEQWQNTSYLRSDGKEEYRERKDFGNRHVIFEPDAIWGEIHDDQYNATDFPVGTVKHFSNYVEEKTGIPQGLVTLATLGISAYVGYKGLKWASKNL